MKKCNVFLRKAKWSDRLISAKGISAQPEKIEALMSMQRPNTVAELQTFLCAMNWLINFVPKFLSVSAVLSDLLELASRKKRSLVSIKKPYSFLWTTCIGRVHYFRLSSVYGYISHFTADRIVRVL